MTKKIILLVLIFFILGCDKKENIKKIEENKIKIVTTTTILGDLIKEIGGEKVKVEVLMREGVSPHYYQPKLSDIRDIKNSDLLVGNGLYLEGKLEEILKNIDGKKVLIIGNRINKDKLILIEEGEYDPHIFLSLDLWKEAALILRNKLIELDGKNSDYFISLTNNYLNKLESLKNYSIKEINKIKKENRILITSHRAFEYFARDYGFETNYIKDISAEGEVKIAEINNLVKFIINKKVKTIFLEKGTSENILETIIQACDENNWEVKVGGELYVGSLGDKESGIDTYIKYYKKNIDTIVKNLN